MQQNDDEREETAVTVTVTDGEHNQDGPKDTSSSERIQTNNSDVAAGSSSDADQPVLKKVISCCKLCLLTD